MAITMRKGAYADFDPSKMKAGEWAVSTDTDSNKQQVWMCFSPGVVKRMGTVEDFDMEIQILIRQYLDSMAESVEKAQESAELATSKAQESANSASNAKTSETNAKNSETNALNSATKAKTSETNSKTSETKAKASETSASTSASNAKTSETKAKASETNAKKSETNASTSATNAKSSETNAKASATNASTSANNAKASETKAKEYEESARSTITVINQAAEATRLNKEAAAQSEANAKASENQALSYKNSASASEQASKASETNAKASADNASASASSASTSASEASKSKTSASTSASQAKASETNAKTSETNSAKSESEAKKYADQVKEISESFSGALRPLGTINFADLPSTAEASSGDMYNIADQFTTTTDFKEGAGNIIPAGSNVYLTIDRYWDVLAGTPVTGVKGNAEKTYRRGNVNITPANIGLGNLTNDRQIKGLASGTTNGHIVSFGADGYTVADSGLTASQIKTLAKPYATCATGRATNAKVATLAGFVLNIGVTIAVKFTDAAGTENPASGKLTLNVNNTGAKPIGYTRNGSKAAAAYSTGAAFYNNVTRIFTYDGTYWICMDYNPDNNTINSAGATNKAGTKLFLVGTTAQNNGITSYSNANCYIGTDNKLYSGGKVVANNEDLTALSDKVGATDISAIGDGTVTGAISEVNQSLSDVNSNLDVKNITTGVKNLTDESTGIDYILKTSGNIAFFSCTVKNFRKANSGWANIIQLPSELIPESTNPQKPLGMCSDGQMIRVNGKGIQMYGTHNTKEDVAFTVNWIIK